MLYRLLNFTILYLENIMYNRIKNDMLQARINNDTIKKSILGVLIGEIQLEESRSGTSLDDNGIITIIKRVKKGCDEMSKYNGEFVESEILEQYLPKTLTIDEIQCIIIVSPLYQEIIESSNHMKLMNKAQDLIRETGQNFDGKDVAIVMKSLKD